MTIHPGSTEVLTAVSDLLDGIEMRVVGDDGRSISRFGVPTPFATEVRAGLPEGSLIGSFPSSDGAKGGLVRALLELIAGRERLESDMESMGPSGARLMDRVYELVEALPQLAAGVDDVEIAKLAARACQRAAGVRQVVYLSYSQALGRCEVVAHEAGDAPPPEAVDAILPAGEGFVAEVLAADGGVLFRTVPEGQRLGASGSPEHLAMRQVLGLPVTFGASEKRLVIGMLLLIDKSTATYERDQQSNVQRGETGEQLGNEEVQVAESFAAMLGAVLGARRTAAAEKELTMARAIQRQILPGDGLLLEGFDVASEYRSSGAVGGDYFDYVRLADGRTLVVVADVSGHNLASGMMMVNARAMLRTLAFVHREPDRLFEDLAAAMFEDLVRTERFLTAAGLVLRGDDRSVDYVNAGHNDLLVYRAATDEVERLASVSTILGFLPRPDYAARRIELSPGDCALLFTDGIVESTDQAGEMFGDTRLVALLAQLAPGGTAQDIVDGLMAELDLFCRGKLATDDVTAVVIKCLGGGDQS